MGSLLSCVKVGEPVGIAGRPKVPSRPFAQHTAIALQQPGATPPINSKVAAGISGLFGQSEGADCQLVFVLDPAPPTGEPAGAGDASAGCSGVTQKKEAVKTLGEPLPAHSIVLRYASDKLAAQLKWPESGGAGSTCGPRARPSRNARTSGAAAKSAAPQNKQLPEVQVMLGGEEELPAASAAIQFAYTGRVQPGISVREALQVRQQAAYLLLDGCVEACVEVIRGALVQGSAGSGSLAATACAAASGSGSVAATTGAAAAGSGNAAATTFAAAAGSGSAAATAVAAAAGSGNAAAAASAAAAGSGNATAATTGAAAAGSGNATAATTGAAAAGSGNAAVLELYSCAALWPDPAENAAFAALLTEAKRRMVAHFGDALAVLNNKERYEQMVALPAVGLEALLESDDFGTDSESSVVLLLAEWMAANHASTDEALRRRLCGLLRLAQCSRAYLAGVLPVLAARHQRSPASAAGWFPMSVTEATCMLAYSTASEPERKAMSAEGQAWGPCAGMATMPVGWRNTQPRRQRLPADGRSFDFSAGLTEMEKSFGALKPGEEGLLYPRLPGSRLGDVVVAQGLEWQPFMKWVSGASTAGVFASPREPAALAATAASRTAAAEGELLTGAVAAVPRMRLSVSGAAGQHSWSGRYDAAAVVRIWCGWGWAEALKLHEAATNQQPNGSNGTGSNVNSKLAARWAPYLQGGTRLEGSMVLLPPAS